MRQGAENKPPWPAQNKPFPWLQEAWQGWGGEFSPWQAGMGALSSTPKFVYSLCAAPEPPPHHSVFSSVLPFTPVAFDGADNSALCKSPGSSISFVESLIQCVKTDRHFVGTINPLCQHN